ncbi:hypothetical protein ATCCBAA256_02140 [Mycobacterium montefiorense]|nr:hypothetical protein ATCCBAA256_02140 [Mycobacterium montefiorense]
MNLAARSKPSDTVLTTVLTTLAAWRRDHFRAALGGIEAVCRYLMPSYLVGRIVMGPDGFTPTVLNSAHLVLASNETSVASAFVGLLILGSRAKS